MPKSATQLLIYLAILLLLLLSSINLQKFLSPVKVLGTQTSDEKETLFWDNFLTKNPGYIPGWIEIGQSKKAMEIDPNYIPEVAN